MTELFENPMGTYGFEFVEYAAPDPQALRALFERLRGHAEEAFLIEYHAAVAASPQPITGDETTMAALRALTFVCGPGLRPGPHSGHTPAAQTAHNGPPARADGPASRL